MKQWIKYGACSFITAIVLLMALYALNRGYRHMNGDVSDDTSSIFKPFSTLFGKEKEDDSPRDPRFRGDDHSPKKEKKESESQEKRPEEKQSVQKDLTITESDIKYPEKEGVESKNSESSSTILLIQQAQNKREFLKTSERQIVMPAFNNIFIPVYSTENLTDQILKSFQNSFPSADPRNKLFVIEKGDSSASALLGSATSGFGLGMTYEIAVYGEDRQFLGTFTTDEDSSFPFRGLPQFLKVEGNQFESSSRFLIFSDASQNTNAVLNTESHLETLLKSVYQPNLDPQLRIGQDPKSGLEIYTLFPGIFIATSLR